MKAIWLALLLLFVWWGAPTEARADSCLTRTTLSAFSPNVQAPVICNEFGQLYAVSVNSDGTQVAQHDLIPWRWPVRYDSPYLYRTASGGLTCTTSVNPSTFTIGQAVPVQCNQYGQLLVELSGAVSATAIPEVTVAQLPSATTSGLVRIVTDGISSTDCIGGGGSTRALCGSTGSTWSSLGGSGSEVDTLDTVFDRGKIIDAANSLANAVRIGDGTTPGCLYTDASLGFRIRPCTAANTRFYIETNFTGGFYDIEAGADILTIDPDAASVNAMYSFGTAYRPLKSIYFSAGAMSTDGTQCGAPTERTINSGPKLFTIICTDNDASRMHGVVVMPDSWDAGTLTFEVSYVQTAADTAVLNMDVAAACRDAGTTINATYGTEVAIDDAAVSGSNIIDQTTSAAVTANGTCVAGDLLYWYLDLDATGTTTAVATLQFLGVKLEYSISSLSD